MKARSRILQPGFFLNEDLSDLDFQTRLYFAGLFVLADKSGRLEYRPKQIKAYLFPYDDADIDFMTNSLAKLDFVSLYNAPCLPNQNNDEVVNIKQLTLVGRQKQYLQIINWDKHQNPHWNEKESEIPEQQQLTLVGSTKGLSSSLQVIERKRRIKRVINKEKQLQYNIIIMHLNEVTGKNFSVGEKMSDLSVSYIKKRLETGWTLEDFQYVHFVKAEEWLGTQFEKFLCPKTLYADSHYEAYRNQRPKDAFDNLPDVIKENAMLCEQMLREKGLK